MAEATTLAYAAGLMDGEGTISITEIASDGVRRKAPQFRAYLSMTMTDMEGVMLMSELFGGNVRSYSSRGDNHKPTYAWSLTGTDRVAAALTELLPFLRLKKRQAELVLLYVGRTKNWTTKLLPQSEIDARRSMKQDVQALNKRGL